MIPKHWVPEYIYICLDKYIIIQFPNILTTWISYVCTFHPYVCCLYLHLHFGCKMILLFGGFGKTAPPSGLIENLILRDLTRPSFYTVYTLMWVCFWQIDLVHPLTISKHLVLLVEPFTAQH